MDLGISGKRALITGASMGLGFGVAEALANPEKTADIEQLVKDGSFYGMQSFDQSLISLFRDGVITLDAALVASTDPHDLTVELRRLGLVA